MTESLLEDYDLLLGDQMSPDGMSSALFSGERQEIAATGNEAQSTQSSLTLNSGVDSDEATSSSSGVPGAKSVGLNTGSDSSHSTSLSRLLSHSTRSKLEQFASFARQNSHAFERFRALPLLCAQQAYSSGHSGSLCDAGGAAIKGTRSRVPIVQEEEPTRRPGTPLSSILRTRIVTGARFRCVAMTPDGRVACTGGGDQLLRIWDVNRLRCIRAAEVGGRLFKVAISDNARCVIGVDDLGKLHRWDLSDKHHHSIMDAHHGHALACSITPDGRFALTGGWDKHVKLWELDTLRLVHDLYQHGQGYVNCVAFAADGRQGISGHSPDSAERHLPRMVVVWDLVSGRPASNPNWSGFAKSLTVNPDDGSIVCGNRDGEVFVAGDIEEPLLRFEAHNRTITSLSFRGSYLLSAGEDGFVKRWNWNNKREDSALHVHEGGVADMAVAMTGSVAVSVGTHDQSIRAWDSRMHNRFHGSRLYTEPLEMIRTLPAHDLVVLGSQKQFCIAKRSTGRVIKRSKYSNGAAYLVPPELDLHSGRCLFFVDSTRRYAIDVTQPNRRRLFGGQGVSHAELFPGGNHGFVCRPDENICIWEWNSLRLQHTPLRPWNSDDGPRGLDDNRFLRIAGENDVLRIGDLVTGAYLAAIPLRKDENQRVLCRDGRYAIIPTTRDSLRGIDLVTGATIFELSGTAGQFENCLLTSSGLQLITYDESPDTTLFHVWDLRSRTRIRTFSQSGARAKSVTLAPGDTHLVTLFRDDTLRILEIATGKCVAAFHDSRGLSEISSLRPDGWLVAGCRTGHVAFLKINGLSLGEPLVTPVRRWAFARRGQSPGWEKHLTVACPWCEMITAVGSNKFRKADSVNAGCPSLTIADRAWRDKRLVSKCPRCGRRMRLTPFIIDRSRSARACDELSKFEGTTRRRIASNVRDRKSDCVACEKVLKDQPLLVTHEGAPFCGGCMEEMINAGPVGGEDPPEVTCCICDNRRPVGWQLNRFEFCEICGLVGAEQLAYRADIFGWTPDQALEALSGHTPRTRRITAILRQYDIRRLLTEKAPQLFGHFMDSLVRSLGFGGPSPADVAIRGGARDACIAVGRKALPWLIKHHRDPSWRLRANAVFAATKIDSDDNRTRSILRSAVSDTEPAVRSWATDAIIHCQGQWFRRLLDPLLSDTDDGVRKNAWRVINLWDDLAGKDAKSDRGYKHILESLEEQGLTDEHRRGFLMSLEGRRSTWSRKTRERLTRELTSNSP